MGDIRNNSDGRKAQAILEIAAFGAIVIFIIGLIVQQGYSSTQQQNIQLQSLRIALLKSYESSQQGSAARNSGSFMLIEDRLSPAVGKYGPLDRQVFMSSGSGVMSYLLFRPVDWEDLPGDLPLTDVSVNGQDFVFRTAAAVKYTINPGSIVANDSITMQSGSDPDAARLSEEGVWAWQSIVKYSEDWTGSADCSNMRRNAAKEKPCSATVQDKIPWKWKKVSWGEAASEINLDDGVYPNYDIDGDRSEETIYKISGNSVWVIDWNAGDMDSGADEWEFEDEEDIPGLKETMEIVSMPVVAGDRNTLEVKEDGASRRATSFSSKSQMDIITRKFVLNPRMIGGGTLCSGGTPLQGSIEACCYGEGCCSSADNAYKTCFQYVDGYGKKVLYIRSRIQDERKSGWTTPVISADIGDRTIFK